MPGNLIAERKAARPSCPSCWEQVPGRKTTRRRLVGKAAADGTFYCPRCRVALAWAPAGIRPASSP